MFNIIAISRLLYNTGISTYNLLLQVASIFNAKARLFCKGRQNLLARIKSEIEKDPRPKIWIHCASLGEFEQGRPLLESLKRRYPGRSIVLTFFSPSGYEARKTYRYADHVFYLPLDTKKNAKQFVSCVQPELALFVKYEFWYHYLNTLHQHHIPAVLFSAVFQQRQPFFKWYGSLFRSMLHLYKQIFVQDTTSKELLENIGVAHVQIAGDTRFDRAAEVLELEKTFHTIEEFKQDNRLIIAGSTWPADDVLIHKLLSKLPRNYKLLIAPHQIEASNIARLETLFARDCCLWAVDEDTLREKRVCIVHTMGQLSYLYRYADIVWVGGGFTRSGIHNVIEPAVFGAPIFFGPRFHKYNEAVAMIEAGAAKSVSKASALAAAISNEEQLQRMGQNAQQFVQQHLGATKIITDYLVEKCFCTIA
jgi:3-deoxy-D-manno-octulosonic-acid transferase